MADSPLHSDATEIHVIPNWLPADATALAAISPVAGDDGKFAWQQDDDSLHMLVDYTGPTWVEIGGSGDVAGPASSVDNQIPRFHLTTGKILQTSGLIIDDNADLQMADNEIVRSILTDYGIKHSAQASVSGAVDVDLENGNSHKITLTGNITSMTFSNPPSSGIDGSLTLYVVQGGTGSYTIAWPAAVDWPGGTGPTISTGVGSMDIYVFKTIDGGTTWYGAQVGADYS